MVEDENLPASGDNETAHEYKGGIINWLKKLANETHWSLVFGVLAVYPVSQGLGGAFNGVGTEYYMKDVQKLQPSESQINRGMISIPWLVKPIWGLFTDIVPVLGYRRKPYFILAGKLFIYLKSLGSYGDSIGSLVGFSICGILVYLLGPLGALGLLTIPAGLVILVGIMLDEPFVPDYRDGQVIQKFVDAIQAMWTTLKYADVWRPCLYMHLSFALSVNIHERMFYCYTDSKEGPSFSQLLFSLSGMLDLMMVLLLNLKLGVPDYVSIVIDESVAKMIVKLKWLPVYVLSSKLWPPGIEGTFFALLISIDNAGNLSSSWGGGLLLHIFNVTRTRFDNLWLVIIVRSLLSVTPLCLICLVRRVTPDAFKLPREISSTEERNLTPEGDNIEMTPLASRNVDTN